MGPWHLLARLFGVFRLRDRLSAGNLVENLRADPQASGAGRRLDSWKEIASYLKRSVRSVQRWEAEEGMPVHRHLHDKRGSVYAFAEELDAWWKERGSTLIDRNGTEEVPPPPPKVVIDATRKPSRTTFVAAGFGLAVVLIGLVAWLSRSGSGESSRTSQALPFQARDWILVADFQNRTGERLFDGAIEYALARELSNSRHANVVSRERVGDALRLMRRPLDSRLDAQLAREVCLRDGGIRALLTGRIDKPGSKYLFSVELVEPKQGTSVAAFSEESDAPGDSLAAMRRLSDRVRAALGETPAPDADKRAELAKVTTSSLRALQLYSQAEALMPFYPRTGTWAGAEELLRQAVTVDPNFASAYIYLAHAIHNQGRPRKDYIPYAETALRLSDGITDRERYFIRGSYYHLLDQREKAIAAYEALLALHPDHPWATGNLLNLYDRWKDLDRILEAEIREADARPGLFNLNFHAAYDFIRWKQQPARGQPYLRRARELVTPEVMEDFSWEWSWLESLPFTERWAEGNLQEAAREADRLAARLDSLARTPRDTLADETAHAYLTLGRIAAAETVARKVSHPGRRAMVLAHVCLIRGDRTGIARHLRNGETEGGYYRPWTWIPILEARSGLFREARGWLPRMEEGPRRWGWADRRETVLGEIAFAQGNLDEAVLRFEEAARRRHPDRRLDWAGSLLGAESFAAALRRKGQTERAVEVLEQAQGEFRPFDTLGPYWQKNRLDLARLYRSVGRAGEARVIEADLSKRLSLADADHPIVLELQRLQKAS